MKKQLIIVSAVAGAVTLASFIGDGNGAKNTGIDVTNMDKAVKPTDDFYHFVNGNWLKNNPIPETESRWGSFNELDKTNKMKLRTILEAAAVNKAATPGSNEQKIGDFYASAMDSVKLNKDGVSPLKDEFAAIEKITNTDELVRAIGHLHLIGVGVLFGGYIGPDPKVSSEYITQFYQGGLGLPDRDYYTKTDERSLGIQKAYKEHIGNIFRELGDQLDVAEKNAAVCYDIELNLAKASMTYFPP